MAKLDIPPVNFNIEVDGEMSPQSRLASEMLAICKMGYKHVDFFLGKNLCITTKISNYIDMFSADDSKELVMRIVINPAMASHDKDFNTLMPSTSYLAMTLEFGELCDPDEQDYVTDDSYDWTPYIAAIVNLDGENEADVVSARTGESLDDLEMNTANVIVEMMRKEVVATIIPESYEKGMIQPEAAEVDPINSVPAIAKELTADLYHPYPCSRCIDARQICIHPMAN